MLEARLWFRGISFCCIYMTDLLQHQPTKSLRSSSSHQLFIRRHNISGSCAFRFSASQNSLPLRIRESQLFMLLNVISRLIFPVSLSPPSVPQSPDSDFEFGAIISLLLTYLITYSFGAEAQSGGWYCRHRIKHFPFQKKLPLKHKYIRPCRTIFNYRCVYGRVGLMWIWERPCSDFMDMLRRLISCRIIIIYYY